VVELRQYTLHPEQRDTLIDRYFVETQEAVGIKVLGQFRDLDDPNRFVWLRVFADMPSRAQALDAFYGGPVWVAHRDAANATMIAWNNVFLLRPVLGGTGQEVLDLDGERPAPGTGGDGPGLVIVTVLHLDPSMPLDESARHFGAEIRTAIEAAGGTDLGPFVTETSPNTYPRLPVREGERVCVMLARFPDAAALERYQPALERHRAVLQRHLVRAPEVLRLKPTARSRLHGRRGASHDPA
jgi:hypothetical protein